MEILWREELGARRAGAWQVRYERWRRASEGEAGRYSSARAYQKSLWVLSADLEVCKRATAFLFFNGLRPRSPIFSFQVFRIECLLLVLAGLVARGDQFAPRL